MSEASLEQFKTVRTTVTIPAELVRQSQHYIDKGAVPSRNALIIAALERFLAELERQEIDQQFAAMAIDETYQAFNTQLAEEFAKSDWEALSETEEQTNAHWQ